VIVHGAPPSPFALAWNGEPALALPHGTLAFVRAIGEGLSLSRLSGRPLCVRSRRGGERLAVAPERPRRTLKRLLQEAGLPPWERTGLPLVFVDETLAAVPGIGVAREFQAGAGDPGLRVEWRARDAR
jgi:tRNA(Ile)-lysidine synthase